MTVSVARGSVEIEPATLTQVVEGIHGGFVVIPDDAGNVVRDLQRIDPTFRARYSLRGKHYVIYQHLESEDGKISQHFCFTAQNLDQRCVQRAWEITHPDYDASEQVEKINRDRKNASRARFREKLGAAGEKLAWAARKDLGVKDRIAL